MRAAFVEDDEVLPEQVVGHAALAPLRPTETAAASTPH
jgi:hypothetical protein